MATVGRGAGGKFRKKPFRRPHSTPYDRPPTAIRIPTIVPGADGDSWLRKLMDPAQKLLATTARRFYNSVFRKRLTQPLPSPSRPSQPPDSKEEALDKCVAAISLNIAKEREVASSGHEKPTHTFGPAEASSMDLEEILKQKTFTRSEIDHLMSLLLDKVVDNPVEEEDKTPAVLPLRPGLFHERKDELANITLQDNRSGSHIISRKAINSSVLDEDVASPADLAKAYMGIRPSKVSPPVLGLQSQAVAEDSPVLSSLVHSPKSPIISLVPSSSGHVGVRENGYVTHKSRGRSAIYSMARTPYSRVNATSILKSSGPMVDGYDGPSSTAQASERNRISGSSKPLKQSSSIFENDIGSGGPIRRIRLKPSLSYRRNWTMSTSEAGELPSSSMKMQSMSEKRLSFSEQSNAAPVSSKSTEMATKILQQLDKIVSPPKERSSELKLAVARERALTKLSPSKLQGQALNNQEYIGSSKFFQFRTDDNKPDDAEARFSRGSGETNKEKHDRIEQNGPLSIFAASDRQSPIVNGVENDVIGKKDAVPVSRTGDANVTNSLAHAPLQKIQTFNMSADEDCLDLEDGGYSNGISSSLIKVIEKQDTRAVELKPSAAQATIISEKHEIVAHDEHRMDSLAKTISQGANGKQMIAQTCADFSFPSLPHASTSSQPDLLAIQSPSGPAKAALLASNATPPLFSSGVKVDSPKDHHVPPIFGFASNNEFTTGSSDKNPQLKFQTYSSGELISQKTPLDSAQSLSSDASASGGLFSSVVKVPESDTAQDKKTLKDRVFSGMPDGATVASVPTISSATLTYGVKLANSSNGSTVSTPILVGSSTITSEKPLSTPSFPVTFSGNSSSSKLSSTSATTSTLATFRFGSSPSNSVSQTSSSTAIAAEEAKHKADIGPGNMISSPFAAANSSSRSNIFGFGSAPAPSSGNNQKEGSAITGAANGSTPVPESPATGAGVASFTQNDPIQFGMSSSSKPSTSVAASTSSSSFSLSSAAKLFSSGRSFGTGTVSSSEPSSLSQTSSSLFGQTSTAPTFASLFNSKSPSAGFSFGSPSSSSSTSAFGSAPGSSSTSSGAPTFGLSGTSSIFGSSGTSSTSGVSSVFGSTGISSASSATSVFGSMGSSSVSAAASVFGLNTASSIPSPFFGSMGASSGPTFSVTAASANPKSGPTLSFTSAVASPSPSPVFGSSNSPFTFGSPAPASKGNTDQMSMEDSMAKDVVQPNHTSTPPAPVFGQQQPIALPAGFTSGSNAAAGANPFQFGAQQNLSTPQSPPPFQASGSLAFNAGGGSFSLGTGGSDKSGRKMVKINRNKLRRK